MHVLVHWNYTQTSNFTPCIHVHIHWYTRLDVDKPTQWAHRAYEPSPRAARCHPSHHEDKSQQIRPTKLCFGSWRVAQRPNQPVKQQGNYMHKLVIRRFNSWLKNKRYRRRTGCHEVRDRLVHAGVSADAFQLAISRPWMNKYRYDTRMHTRQWGNNAYLEGLLIYRYLNHSAKNAVSS